LQISKPCQSIRNRAGCRNSVLENIPFFKTIYCLPSSRDFVLHTAEETWAKTPTREDACGRQPLWFCLRHNSFILPETSLTVPRHYTMKFASACSFETLARTYQTTRRHVTEDFNFFTKHHN